MDRATMRSVLAGSDLSEGSDDSLRAAAALATTYGAELHVFHAVAAPSSRRRAREQLERQVRRVLGEDVAPASVEAAAGEPSRALIDRAARIVADVLVLGPHRPRGALDTLLGSTAERIVRSVPLPCLIANRPLSAPVHSILAATDLSTAAGRALELAVRWFGAGATVEPTIIEVLYVTEPDADAARIEALQPRLREQLEAVRRRLPVGSPAKLRPRILAAASPADGIESAAEELEADLVVLGTRGQSALSRALIGSVASAVTRTVPFPLLLVPPAGS